MKIRIQIDNKIDVYNDLESVYDGLNLMDRAHFFTVFNETDLEDIIKEEYSYPEVKVTLIQHYKVEYTTLFGKSNVEYYNTEEEAYKRFRILCFDANHLMTTPTAITDQHKDMMIVKKIVIGKLDIQGNYNCMSIGQMRMMYEVQD